MSHTLLTDIYPGSGHPVQHASVLIQTTLLLPSPDQHSLAALQDAVRLLDVASQVLTASHFEWHDKG